MHCKASQSRWNEWSQNIFTIVATPVRIKISARIYFSDNVGLTQCTALDRLCAVIDGVG